MLFNVLLMFQTVRETL